MTAFDPEKITFFAKTDARGKNVPFGIKAKDRQRHMYVIGKTGMGKSTMLENMAIQDIQNGEGMAFIDPHGSTADKLLDYVPKERMKDVLYFAPFDMDHPVSFNVMEDVGPDRRHLVVSGLMSTFKKIWVDAWSARMEYILSNTLLALLEYPDSTLLGVNRMLSDKQYRETVVANISDPSVKSFWVDEFAKYNERYMQEAGDAIKNKIGQFTANPLIRNIIGQPKSSFNVRDIMDGQKILIMNLSKGLVGETNANLLGSMLITRIYLSAMSRADLTNAQMEKMPNFYFYVDEFQSFANETFANILSEARKYKLNLTIAHQYIEQMEEEVRNAVFGNVGTTVVFRVGPLDAEFLETVFTPQFTATDLVNLGFAQIYLTLMIDGIGSRPFSAVTLPPIEQAEVSYHDQIVAESRRQFAHARSEVEEVINAWHAPIASPGKPNGNERQGGRNGGNNGGNGGGQNHERPRDRSKDTDRKGRSGAPSPSKNNERQQRDRTEEPAPVKHKNMDELRSVLQNISGSGSSGTKAEPKESKEAVRSERQDNEQKDAQHMRDERAEGGRGDASRANDAREQRSNNKKHDERRSKGSHDHQQGRKDESPKTETKKENKSPSTEDLKAVLARLAREHEAQAKRETPKVQPAKEMPKEAKPSAPTESPTEPKQNTMRPADEITRKQLERMLRVNGQEKPPLR